MNRATLIINDRADICLASEADGIHLGQDDLSPAAARKIFDSVSRPSQLSGVSTQRVRVPHPFADESQASLEYLSERVGGNTVTEAKKLLIGFSTHNLAQVREADTFRVDYIAVGPVFATGSKANPDPVIGVEGVRQARSATSKPLVAIGGITRLNCRQVKDAGADSVAVISDLLESPGKAVADFLRILG
ncbi:MAG TPA: thiamine phosphate synthase [Candidatus Angelobacter sp.]|nr:thiamine phosphate synthase [Candidatus Angelobacter sp.]